MYRAKMQVQKTSYLKLDSKSITSACKTNNVSTKLSNILLSMSKKIKCKLKIIEKHERHHLGITTVTIFYLPITLCPQRTLLKNMVGMTIEIPTYRNTYKKHTFIHIQSIFSQTQKPICSILKEIDVFMPKWQLKTNSKQSCDSKHWWDKNNKNPNFSH